MKLTRPRAAALLLTAGLASACGNDSETTEDTAGTTSAGTTSAQSTAAGNPTPGGGRASGQTANAIAALQTAASAVPSGQPFDLETDTYQGQPVWDIKVASDGNEFHLYVSEDGNSVVSQEQDDNPDDDVAKVESAQLSAVEAVQRAVDQAGGEVSEMEIDSADDGTVLWQVDLDQPDGSEVEVNLDANTGDVVTASGN